MSAPLKCHTILYFIVLSTLVLGTKASRGRLAIKILSFQKPSAVPEPPNSQLQLTIWFHEDHSKLGHTLSYIGDSGAETQKFIRNLIYFDSPLKKQITMQCAYIDASSKALKNYTRLKTGTFTTKEQAFEVNFDGGCSWKFELTTFCPRNWYGLSCDKSCNVTNQNTRVCNQMGEKVCHTGWKGENCQIDINECREKNPCKNNGTCINFPGKYRCKCPSAYQGEHCDVDRNECKNPYACIKHLHTYCFNTNGSYECRCKTGTSASGPVESPNCVDVNECIEYPCEFGSTCINTLGSFKCKCQTGFNGSRCETIDDCLVFSPCRNNGKCVMDRNTFECYCIHGFSGRLCEEMDDSKKRVESHSLEIIFYVIGLLALTVFVSSCFIYVRDSDQGDDDPTQRTETISFFTWCLDLVNKRFFTHEETDIVNKA